MKGDEAMTVKNINALELFAEWAARDPELAAGVRAGVNKLELARVLRQLREAAGMSQVALAAASRTTQSAIARIESGKTLPKIDVVARIVSALGGTWHSHFRLANGVTVVLDMDAPAPHESLPKRVEKAAPPRAARAASSRAGR